MKLRTLYFKVKLFLFSARTIIQGIVLAVIFFAVSYFLVNNFLFEDFIVSQARFDQLTYKYDNAINLYKVANVYYKVNHFSPENREIYFEIPYRLSMCYLAKNDKKQSIVSMLDGLTAIQVQYGIFSRETAYFTRKYLIEYYLANNQTHLARKEFDNLLIIYKNIGYNYNEMSDMIRIDGDLSYQKKDYDTAMMFYEKAYDSISTQTEIDYNVYTKVINRICDYKVQKGDAEEAVNIYKGAIGVLKNAGGDHNELTANMLMKLGDLYHQIKLLKSAIDSYEEAIELIKKLPTKTFLKQNLSTCLITLKGLYNEAGQFHKVEDIDVELARQRRFSFMF